MKAIDKLREILCEVPIIDASLSCESNSIQERHLRMYFKKKGYDYMILAYPSIVIKYWNRKKKIVDHCKISIDDTKDFHQQDESTIQQIVDFLLDNK